MSSPELSRFWSIPEGDLLGALRTDPSGLRSEEARKRLLEGAPRALGPERHAGPLRLFIAQLKSPIILILLVAAILSFFLHDQGDAIIILTILLASALLGAWQEGGAARAVEKLLATVRTRSVVVRDGTATEVPLEEVVPGDVVLLSAGSAVPGDGRLLEVKDLFIVEASLTGETFPVQKRVAMLPDDAPLGARANCVFLGTHVASGLAKAVMVRVGRQTEFGAIAERLKLRPPETEFERGIRRFGYLLLEVTLLLVILIFALNVYLHRPILESFLFSLALAVGLTPQLLPAIITVNLAHGARRMALHRVIVKRLPAIENLGSMDVLCSDKTGTLTEGVVRLQSSRDFEDRESERVFLLASLNARFAAGFVNPLDEAIQAARDLDISGYRKLDEVPYDFVRKRQSVLVSTAEGNLLATKGAVESVLGACTSAQKTDGAVVDLSEVRSAIEERVETLSTQGLRTLGVAYRQLGTTQRVTRDDERAMTFAGLLVFEDRPKRDVEEVVGTLRNLGVSLKIITGDDRRVAVHVARQIGLEEPRVLSGTDLRTVSDEALVRRVPDVDLFAEVEPNQKERVILALKKAGHVVGFLGDGINDASALHVADVGISVDSAADVAKDAAEFVLLEKDLRVLQDGIVEGRKTFLNTLKYVFMATSANFGNMFSVAGASLLVPFLPMLPKQILLINFLTDLPEMTIATDNVDPLLVQAPRRWDVAFIRRFMIVFGLLSSGFDFVTFAIVLHFLGANPKLFRSGWFVESVLSATVVVFALRTRLPFLRSRPSPVMLAVTAVVAGVTLLLPFSPLAAALDFEPLPGGILLAIVGIVAAYFGAAELAKRLFYRHESRTAAVASAFDAANK